MLKSKAIELVKTFSKEEYKRFEDFVRSPYFNKSGSLIKLAATLKKFHPSFDSENFTEDYIYSKVFGKDKYSYGVMRNLMSDFLFLCESFIVNDKLNSELFTNGMNVITLLDEYQKRDLFSLYYFRNKKFSEELEKQKINSGKFKILSEFEALQQEYEFNKVSYKPDIKKGFYLRALYDLCVISIMLYRNTNNVYFSSVNLDGNPEDSILYRFVQCIDIDGFISGIKSSDPEEKVYIELFLTLISLIKAGEAESDKYYYKARDVIFKQMKSFDNDLRYSLLNILRNYCIYPVRYRHMHFRNELYRIYRVMLENVDFFSNKLGSHLASLYEEIIITAVDRGEFDFAISFMKKYTELIDKEVRESMSGYVNAYINFVNGNYEKTLEILSTIKPPNVYNAMRMRYLYLCTFYELNYFEEGFSMLDSFRHYISGNKTSESHKVSYSQLQNIFTHLFRYKSSPEKYSAYELEKLRENVNNYNSSMEKGWMLKKVDELSSIIKG